MQTPYYLKSRKCWYVWIGKGSSRKQVNLGRDEQTAWQKYHQLMLDQKTELGPSVPVYKLLDEFLCWVERRRKEGTLNWYLQQLKPFSDFIGKQLTVAELKPFHVTRFIDAHHDGAKANTIHGAIRAISRAFNWAIKEQYLTHNPIAGIEKPKPTRREMTLSEEQFAQIMQKATDQEERDLLEYLWETGTRAEEVVKIEARRHVDAAVTLAQIRRGWWDRGQC